MIYDHSVQEKLVYNCCKIQRPWINEKQKSAFKGIVQLKNEYFMDFASSQTADNKIKTAVDPTKTLSPMEAITAQTQINVSTRTQTHQYSHNQELYCQKTWVIVLGSKNNKPLFHSKAVHNQEFIKVSGGSQRDPQVNVS